MPIYSFSRIGCFGTCPRQYKFRYIEKPPIEKVENIEPFMGTIVHDTLEQCYKLAGLGRAPELDELTTIFDRLWKEKYTENIRIVNENETVDDYYNVGVGALQRYHSRFYPFDEDITIGLERHISFSLDDEGKYKLRGFIDRLSRDNTGRLKIQDYKTNKQLKTQQEIDKDEQLALYQIAVQEMWPDNNGIELIWHFVRFDTALISIRSEEQQAELRKKYIQKIQVIEKAVELDNFPTEESNLCNWCEYNEICPAKGGSGATVDNQQELTVIPQDKITEYVDEFIEITKNIKQLNDRQKKLKSDLMSLCKVGEEKIIPGSGKDKFKVSLFQVEKLPTKALDPSLYNEIREILIDSDLYNKYSILNIRSVQKDYDKYKFPGEIQDTLSSFVTVNPQGNIKIVK